MKRERRREEHAPSYCEFNRRIGLTFTPGQHALAAVAVDRVSIDSLPEEEQPLAHKIFGPKFGPVPSLAYSTLAITLGRGSGKTTLTGSYHVWRAFTADLRKLGPGEIAFGLIVAPDLDTARQTLSFVKGAIERVPALTACIVSETSDSVLIRRPNDGRLVSIEIASASAGGKSIRGRSIIALTLEESGFMRDSNSVVNDLQIFQAAVPRLLDGSAIWVQSTPWLRSGLLWSLHEQNFGDPKVAIAAHAPTSLMRTDDPNLLARIEAARERDPINASREFDAEWLPLGAGNLFDPVSLQNAHVEHVDRHGHGAISIGGDLGLTVDPTSFVVCQKGWNKVTGLTADVNVLEVVELKPSRGKPIELERVIRSAAELCSTYGVRKVRVDSWSLAQAREWAAKLRVPITFECASEGDDRQLRFSRAADAIKAGRIKIPRAYPELTEQLSSLVATPRAGGGFAFTAPRKNGSHADSAMAFLLAAEPLWTPSNWDGWRRVLRGQQSDGVRACKRCRRYTITGNCCDAPQF